MPEHYKAIIIGSGQAGSPLATSLAQAGWHTALVEREHVGGTCVNVGCTPTKTMVASARVAHVARRSAEYGVHTAPVTVNMAEVRARKRNMVQDWRDGKRDRLTHTDQLDLLDGEARFTGPHTLTVAMNDGSTRELTGDYIFINTGARPAVPALPGLDSVPFLDSTTIMELGEVPDHLLVLGGGYVGLEFAQMFRRFGSHVTIVQRGPQLLGREDDDVAVAVADILRQDGIEVLLECQATTVVAEGESGVILEVQTARQPGGAPGSDEPAQALTSAARFTQAAPGTRRLRGSHLLVATGRTPNTERLDLDRAGIATDSHGFIRVNDRLETNVLGVWALGDVKGGPAFTHVSYDDYTVLYANLVEGKPRSIAGRLVPYTVFLDPQLGRVGLTEAEARRHGRDIQVAKLPMEDVARAIEVGETRGFMKVVVERSTNHILGCAILGIEGGEIMSMLEIAMMGHLPYTALRDGIFAHPTLAESLNSLFYTLDQP